MSSTITYYMHILPMLGNGLLLTLELSLLAISFGLIIGLISAIMKLSHFWVFKYPAVVYVEVFRGTPLLVQILFMSYAYPQIFEMLGAALNAPLTGLLGFPVNIQQTPGTFTNPDPFWDVVIILSLNTGAYQAEIIRAGIQSIPAGQMEAGRSLGLTYADTMRYIIIPQAFRAILPALAGEFIHGVE